MNNSKIIRIATVAATLDLLGQNHLLANGGAWQTGVPSTGNGAAAQDHHSTQVSILDELLTIDLHQEFAAVRVQYQMQNAGPATQQDFFFPVEEWNQDLDDYEILIDGKRIHWEEVGGIRQKRPESGWGDLPAIMAWKHSKIPFGKGQTRSVTIIYNARYSNESGSISEDSNIGDDLFVYSLSPAATWNGPIRHGKIIVNVLTPQPEEVKILKPRDRLRKVNDHRYEWTFENLKPTLDDNIKIVAHEGYESFPTSYVVGGSKVPGRYLIYKDRYYLSHTDYSVTASSTLKSEGGINYGAENVKGSNQDIAWAEGVDGDGTGEHLDLTVKNPLPLNAILIIPGYAKGENGLFPDDADKNAAQAETVWWNNNRVASMDITLNGEFTFTASIPDERFAEAYPILIRGYSKPVKTIKMVITGVWPGRKFRDTCISLIELRSKLSKKPKMGPVR